jgi:8-oxo-dGTP diphosphatase
VRFCSRCGAQMSGELPVVCGACGMEHWRNAKPGAAGLVVRNGELLLVRRRHDPWCGAWCAPSGFCDGDEHPIETAEREIYEEAGIRARVIGFLGVWICAYADDAATSDSELSSVAYYHAVPLNDDPGSPDGLETAEVAWFPPDRLPPIGLLAPPDRFPSVLEAWEIACRAGETVTPLLDRPSVRDH